MIGADAFERRKQEVQWGRRISASEAVGLVGPVFLNTGEVCGCCLSIGGASMEAANEINELPNHRTESVTRQAGKMTESPNDAAFYCEIRCECATAEWENWSVSLANTAALRFSLTPTESTSATCQTVPSQTASTSCGCIDRRVCGWLRLGSDTGECCCRWRIDRLLWQAAASSSIQGLCC